MKSKKKKPAKNDQWLLVLMAKHCGLMTRVANRETIFTAKWYFVIAFCEIGGIAGWLAQSKVEGNWRKVHSFLECVQSQMQSLTRAGHGATGRSYTDNWGQICVMLNHNSNLL